MFPGRGKNKEKEKERESNIGEKQRNAKLIPKLLNNDFAWFDRSTTIRIICLVETQGHNVTESHVTRLTLRS
jgi:hypothetical protein